MPLQCVVTAKLLIAIVISLAAISGYFLALGAVANLNNSCGKCPDAFRRLWWVLAFQFVLFSSMALAFLKGVVDKVRMAIVAFLVLVSVDTSRAAEVLLKAHEGVSDLLFGGSEMGRAFVDHDTAGNGAVGFIILTFCNLLFILMLESKELLSSVSLDVSYGLEGRPSMRIGDATCVPLGWLRMRDKT